MQVKKQQLEEDMEQGPGSKLEIKSVTVFIVSPSICHEVMGSDAKILVFEC